jgi:nitrogen fixation protein NifU and related proteins
MGLVGPSTANENLSPVLKYPRDHFSHGYNWSTSPQLIDHFTNPRNVGELPPPAVTVEVSNPICGDILRLSVSIDNDRIAQSRFKVRGCTASIAAGSALTELVAQRDKAGLAKLTASDVEHAVGGLSNESKHAAVLCLDAVRALLTQFPV